MKLTSILALALTVISIPFAQAVLEQSPPNSTWVRFYEKPNCDVTFHQTGVKDFKRAVCGPLLKPDEFGACVTGKFLSYRIEYNEKDRSLPKLDKLFVKRKSNDCTFQPGMPEFTTFSTHPTVNPPFLEPGCHSFDAASPLGIVAGTENSFMCTWGSFAEQPFIQTGFPPQPPPQRR